MRATFHVAMALAFAFFSSLATAQEQTTPSQPSAPEVTRQNVGDWTIVCPVGAASGRCVMGQDLYCAENDAGGGITCGLPDSLQGSVFRIGVVTVRILRNGNVSNSIAEFATPLGTVLSQGVCIHFDRNVSESVCYPFYVCSPEACISRLLLTDRQVIQAKRGNEMTARIYSQGQVEPSDRPVDMKVSLDGFTKAYEMIYENREPSQ